MDRSVRGMSLIEVMIAVAVLTIALLSLLTAMPVATKLTRDSEQHEIARHAIEVQLADIRAADGWNSWTNQTNHADADGVAGWSFNVEELPRIDVAVDGGLVKGEAGADGTRQVTVSVNWRGIDKANREVVVTTLVGM